MLSKPDTYGLSKHKRILMIVGLVEGALALILFYLFIIGGANELKFTVFAFMLWYLIPYFLYKKRLYSSASKAVLLITTVLMLVLTWRGEGLKDETMLVFPALAAISILLGATRMFGLIFIVIIVNVFLMGYLNEIGYIHHQVKNGGISSSIFIVIIFVVVGIAMRQLAIDLLNSFNELNEYKNTLEEKVESRTKALSESQNKLAEAEKMASLGRLVAGISHEVNTPIGIALTASTHLTNKTEHFKEQVENGQLTRSAMNKFIETMDSSTSMVQKNLNRASSLISDFKNIAVISSVQRQSRFELSELIYSIVDTVKPVLDGAHSKVKFELVDIYVEQDIEAITQVFTNLLVNSCVHGFEEGQLGNEISIKSELINDELVQITYKDNGVGISSDVSQQIFEPFYTTKRNKGGTGLGMHIVYNIVVHSLNGSIDVHINETDKDLNGAKFVITFPIKN